MDFAKLARDRAAAQEDKADLFDFYHNNFDDLMEYAAKLPQTTYLVVESGYEYNDNWYEPNGDFTVHGGFPTYNQAQDACDEENQKKGWGCDSTGDSLQRYKVVETTTYPQELNQQNG